MISDPDKPLLSKAFQELYLPGSTGKLVTATAALQNGYGPQSTWPNPRVLDLPTMITSRTSAARSATAARHRHDGRGVPGILQRHVR